MVTHFQPVKYGSHPPGLRRHLPMHYVDLTRHHHQARVIQCGASMRHFSPVPVGHNYAMLDVDCPIKNDCERECSRDTSDTRSIQSKTPVSDDSGSSSVANEESSILTTSYSSLFAGDRTGVDALMPAEEGVGAKSCSPVTSYGLRGIKRPTDQALSCPQQKKTKSSDTTTSEADALESNKVVFSLLDDGSGLPPCMKDISEQLMDICATVQHRKDMYVHKMKLRDALYDVIKRIFPYCGLYVIGSSMNGFGNSASDMDLCLMLSHSEIDQKREAMEILHILRKSLLKCNFLRDLRVIHAKVPILKFTDAMSNLECDLNINNSIGIRNTHLLNAYSCLDWRLVSLVVFIKHWAKVQGINNASQGTISSYSLVLMIIHYLQYGCSPPVLPCLQQKYPHKFNVTQDVRVLTLNQKLAPYKSPNKQRIGELFAGFLHYFAYVFKFDEEVMSIRLGRTLHKDLLIQQLNLPNSHVHHQWKFICIEEPFNLSNTAYSVHDAFTFERIKRVFARSCDIIQKTNDVQQIIGASLVPF